ncbi:glycosyltransferase family 87 protein [Enterovirga rhinocerotis]|uniref:Uncharacterized protein DUF2029 n=1 Tax=Enterovirga rhinocerotis TaxID=1339210 RepID=A0A4R7C8P8_9HYPH|nr:glycosyltransferase family 87 protein [Enterovirga rhinocerotis]TDR93685.1 uncharacterized protein DUF2029 [Enterovirga rhinocerotis]
MAGPLSLASGASSPTARPTVRPSIGDRLRGIDWFFVGASVIVAIWALWLFVLAQHDWLAGEVRNHVSTDFAAFWSAGRMVVSGEAAFVYDQARQGAVVREALGPVARAHEYLNPPPFLFVVAPLGLLGYVAAKVAWLAATLAAFLVVARRIEPHPRIVLAALAVPVVFLNVVSGQNGLLTAAIVGAALVLLPARPWLGGILIGALVIKPQLAVLFPFLLAASGNWRAFAGAALSASALMLASLLAFGPETWAGFLHSFAEAGGTVLGDGRTGWGKVQSLFGVLRHLDVAPALAWSIQAAWGVAIAILACLAWARPLPSDLKAAVAAVAIVLVQPYVFIYDEAMLAVAMAFWWRLARAEGAGRGEIALLLLAMLCLIATMMTRAHLGYAAALLVGAVVAGRLVVAWPDRTSASTSARPSS